MVQWEYKVGPLTVNFRVLAEPKGFLRIVLFFIALLAFSITAGFSSTSNPTSNSITCQGFNGTTNSYITFQYPYSSQDFDIKVNSSNRNITTCRDALRYQNLALSSSAGFFVAMGVLTIIYILPVILVYMLFITPDLFMAKWLVLGDFFITIIFGVLYLIACIAWSAGVGQLNSYIKTTLETFGQKCTGCVGDDVPTAGLQTFGQPAISLIFGYLASFIWLASVWFVYKDTFWHKDQTGPLASIYNVTNKNKGPSSPTQQEGGGE